MKKKRTFVQHIKIFIQDVSFVSRSGKRRRRTKIYTQKMLNEFPLSLNEK
jgi:hypothetical protein